MTGATNIGRSSPQGATVADGGVNFSLFSRTASGVDLLFFDQEGKKHSHVGIYLGHGEFVHSPSSGKRVRRDPIDAPYWQKHLSEVRRING